MSLLQVLEGSVVLLSLKLAESEQSPTGGGRAVQLHHPRQCVAALRIPILFVCDHPEGPPTLGPLGTQLYSPGIEVGCLIGTICLVGLLGPGGEVFERLREIGTAHV